MGFDEIFFLIGSFLFLFFFFLGGEGSFFFLEPLFRVVFFLKFFLGNSFVSEVVVAPLSEACFWDGEENLMNIGGVPMPQQGWSQYAPH